MPVRLAGSTRRSLRNQQCDTDDVQSPRVLNNRRFAAEIVVCFWFRSTLIYSVSVVSLGYKDDLYKTWLRSGTTPRPCLSLIDVSLASRM